MNPFAKKIHAHGSADRCNIKRSEKVNNIVKRIEDLLLRHDYLGMITADIVRNLFCILEVDCVLAHADCKCTNRLVALFLSDCTHK